MILAVLLVIVMIAVLYFISKNNRKIRQLKDDYETALKGNDKELARKKGREYYAAPRRYKEISALDDFEISKDIESMK